jgi:hypothetical protein
LLSYYLLCATASRKGRSQSLLTQFQEAPIVNRPKVGIKSPVGR